MSDMQALYAMLAASDASSVLPDRQPTLQLGTFRERLEACLGNYRVKQLEKALIKGQQLHQLMFANGQSAARMSTPPRNTAASAFRHEEAIQANGYNGATSECEDTALLAILSEILRQGSYDFSILGRTFSFEHELLMPAHKTGDHYYPEATAKFSQVINPIGGIIVACENLSPTGANREAERPLGLDVPRLSNWSDMAFLQWRLLGSIASNLRYVLRHRITNEITESIVESINAASATEILQWPGRTYDANSLEGQALLGTPNGSGVAFMLYQHKHDLGLKVINKITAFEKDRELMLLFYIVDVGPRTRTAMSQGAVDFIMAGI